ncbi:twin-arginine translocase subunit TatC [Blattabacterium cuenoti]|uniref:twin-arginine translocase subunit TatC n=1 Tax=Blattabacterium cuenoti TaxID=1653831 RepID=UPI00163CDF03|nr:twin-arginine translocase subunit TatC [Blattabacterium cuenoti]
MNEDKKIPFWKHIEELRKHVIHCLFAILISMIILMNNKNIIFDCIIFAPSKTDFITYRILKKVSDSFLGIHLNSVYFSFLHKNLEIQNRQIFGQFNIYIWTCFVGAIILSFPYVFYEFWKFVKPALSDEEKKYSIWILITITVLFLLGVFFGYFILCPFLIHFGYSFKVSDVPKNIFDLSDYISLIVHSVFSMGIIFLFPFFIFFLTKMELISHSFLRKYRKHAFLIMLVIASAITPGDILSTIIVLIPILILYQVSICISFYTNKNKKVS